MMSILLASIILIDCIYATYVISLNYKQSQEKQKLADFTDQSVKLASGILELSLERSATQLALRTTKKENLKLLGPIITAQRDKSNNYFKSLIEDINKKNNIKC